MAAKRSLFKKPAWAAKTTSPTETDRPIFQQNVYEDILREEKRKESRRLEKAKKREERLGESTSHHETIDEHHQAVKKRRISHDPAVPEDDRNDNDHLKKFQSGYGSKSESPSALSSDDTRTSRKQKRNTRANRNAFSSNRTASPQSTPPNKRNLAGVLHTTKYPSKQDTSVLDKDNTDDEIVVIGTVPLQSHHSVSETKKSNAKQKVAAPSESESDPDEDDYVRDLKRAARAEMKLKKEQQVQRKGTLETGAQPPVSARSGPVDIPVDMTESENAPQPLTEDPLDPLVRVRVKTIIPNCPELFFTRKASQSVERLLNRFIDEARLDDKIARELFFIWNNTKLFKSTTFRSILAQIRHKRGTNPENTDLADRQIELEAVTERIFEHRLKFLEQGRQRAANPGERLSDDRLLSVNESRELSKSLEPSEQPPPKKGGLVILLKSGDDQILPQMNLRVHPHTTIARIVRGYKTKQNLDPTRGIYLMFDGDRLQGEETVAHVGFEDGDTVDVAEQ